tara:strand:- start:25 stop:453 length:429 start_codon:yes stop_codon:yes gene_type:complete
MPTKNTKRKSRVVKGAPTSQKFRMMKSYDKVIDRGADLSKDPSKIKGQKFHKAKLKKSKGGNVYEASKGTIGGTGREATGVLRKHKSKTVTTSKSGRTVRKSTTIADVIKEKKGKTGGISGEGSYTSRKKNWMVKIPKRKKK